MAQQASLSCVAPGMMQGAHFGPRPRSHVAQRAVDVGRTDHQVIAHEAATFPITTARREGMPLPRIVDAVFRVQTTLVIPPARPMQRNQANYDRLALLDPEVAARKTPSSVQHAHGGENVDCHAVS